MPRLDTLERDPASHFFAALLLVLPLAIAPRLLLLYDITPKALALLVPAGFILLRWPTCSRGLQSLLSTHPGRLFLVSLGLGVCSAVISTITSENQFLSFYGSNWRRCGAVVLVTTFILTTFLASHVAVRPAAATVALRAALLASVISAAYAIAQYCGLDPILPARDYHSPFGSDVVVRPPGGVGHSVYFANYLVFGLLFGLTTLLTDTVQRWRTLAKCSLLLVPFALALTGTRAALMSAAAALLVVCWRCRRHFPWRRLLIAAALLLLAGAAFYYSSLGRPLRGRVAQWKGDFWGGTRLLVWRDSLGMVRQRLIWGHGIDVFSTSFLKHQSRELAARYPDYFHESPHNVFLDILAGQGLLGMLAFLGAATSVAWMVVRAPGGSRTRLECLGIACFAGLLTHTFACPNIVTLWYQYCAFALVAGGFHEAVPRRAPDPLPKASAVGMAARVMVMLAWITAAVLAYSDVHMRVLERRFESGRFADALQEYRGTQRLGLALPTSDLWLSRSFHVAAWRSGDSVLAGKLRQAALRSASKALLTADDRHNVYVQLALLSGEAGSDSQMAELLERASETAPRWYRPHFLLAKLYFRTHNLPKGQQAAARAMNLAGKKADEVRAALQQVLNEVRAGR